MKKPQYHGITPSKFLVPIACAAGLAFCVFCAVTYHKGMFDISFIERPTVTVGSVGQTESTEPVGHPQTPSEPSVGTETDAESQINKPTDSASRITDYLASLEKSSFMANADYVITDLEYSDGFVITIADIVDAIENKFSLRDKTVEVPIRVPDEVYSGYTTVMEEHSQARPLVDVYMDYILVDTGKTWKLYGCDGTLLIPDFDAEYYAPAYTRDKNDVPLFIAEEPSKYNPKNKVTRYYSVNEKGELKVNYYNDKTDGRGLYFNYPSYFGKNDTEKNIIHYNSALKLYGYGSKTGVKSEEDYKYKAAFAHSEGLCAAVETDGLMYYLNQNMVTQISASFEFYKNFGNTQRRLLREFRLPDTFGEESIGFFYFDHGLCRVRAQTVDAWHWQQYERRFINADEDILIRTDGTEFPIPTDYKLIAYSNGMLLLEKSGMYGYMDHTGKWILDPVYSYAKPFSEGLAVVGNDGEIGVIDTNGNTVIPAYFDHISTASGGIIAAYDDKCGWTVFNKMTAIEEND